MIGDSTRDDAVMSSTLSSVESIHRRSISNRLSDVRRAPAPGLAEWGLVECPEGGTEAESYRARRRHCGKDCDGALIVGDITTPGDAVSSGIVGSWASPGFTSRLA